MNDARGRPGARFVAKKVKMATVKKILYFQPEKLTKETQKSSKGIVNLSISIVKMYLIFLVCSKAFILSFRGLFRTSRADTFGCQKGHLLLRSLYQDW